MTWLFLKLQFNILDDSLKLCTGFGSFCKRNKFMAWASAGPAEIMNLWVSLVGCFLVCSMGLASMHAALDRGGSYFCPRGYPKGFTGSDSLETRKRCWAKHICTHLCHCLWITVRQRCCLSTLQAFWHNFYLWRWVIMTVIWVTLLAC